VDLAGCIGPRSLSPLSQASQPYEGAGPDGANAAGASKAGAQTRLRFARHEDTAALALDLSTRLGEHLSAANFGARAKSHKMPASSRGLQVPVRRGHICVRR
jgi:hypothetical protein